MSGAPILYAAASAQLSGRLFDHADFIGLFRGRAIGTAALLTAVLQIPGLPFFGAARPVTALKETFA